MKVLFDFFPIILFFLAYKLGDIMLATFVAIIATFAQLMFVKLKTGKYEKTHLISFFVITILGGATILFNNETFVKLKPTAVYWILACTLFFSQFFGQKKPFMQTLGEKTISLPNQIWKKLNYSWCIFFIAMGVTNLYVAYNFNTDTWVNFKLFGTLSITIVFAILQSIYITKYNKSTKGNY